MRGASPGIALLSINSGLMPPPIQLHRLPDPPPRYQYPETRRDYASRLEINTIAEWCLIPTVVTPGPRCPGPMASRSPSMCRRPNSNGTQVHSYWELDSTTAILLSVSPYSSYPIESSRCRTAPSSRSTPSRSLVVRAAARCVCRVCTFSTISPMASCLLVSWVELQSMRRIGTGRRYGALNL